MTKAEAEAEIERAFETFVAQAKQAQAEYIEGVKRANAIFADAILSRETSE